MKDTLNIGRITFTNLFPIFHELQKHPDIYKFIEGVPSEVNKMLREGIVDISTSSSVEYLRDKDNYSYIDGHSISSLGRIRSILLFSRVPIEDLDGKEVSITHQTETSALLLSVILKKFYNLDFKSQITDMPITMAIFTHSAYLSIGDEALTTLSEAHPLDLKIPDDGYVLSTIDHQLFYTYDLGDLWHKKTGLPFVFALWTAKNKTIEENKRLFDRFKKDLDYAKTASLGNIEAVTEASPLKDTIGRKNLLTYWRGISYDLDEEHKKGLSLFEAYLRELELLD